MNRANVDEVRYNRLYPEQLARHLADAPILYVPLGSIEWHSHHMPYGVDSDKAMAILERVALQYGGVVTSAIDYGAMHGSWRDGTHPGLSDEVRDDFYTEVLQGFSEIGFKVFACVSGHWTSRQTGSMNKAIAHVSRNGNCAGFCVFDGADPYDGFDHDENLLMDHAGARETSIFMHLFPERVRLSALETVDRSDLPGEECHLTRSGIQGQDPFHRADAELGRRHVDTVVRLIGERAVGLLETLRARKRGGG